MGAAPPASGTHPFRGRAPGARPLPHRGGARAGRSPARAEAVSRARRTGAAATPTGGTAPHAPPGPRPPAAAPVPPRGQTLLRGNAVSEEPHPVPRLERRGDARERGRQRGQPVRPHGLPSRPCTAPTRTRRGHPTSPRPAPAASPGRPRSVRPGTAGRGQHAGETGQHRVRFVHVHEHAVAQHDVEAAGQEVHARVPAVALDEAHPLPDPGGLRDQRLPGRLQHLRVGLHAGHGVPGARQPQGLRALPHADVEYPQPLPHGVAGRYLLVELAGHQLLTDRVAQSSESVHPVGRRPQKPGGLGAQGRSPV